MRKIVLLSVILVSLSASAQRNVFYKDSFKLKTDFKQQVAKCMNKYHHSHYRNDFYNYNVNKSPVSITEDTILYNLNFIAAQRLWGGDGKFYKKDNQMFCEISNIILLKKTSMSGVDYINVAVNNMEDTKGNRINLLLLEDEIKKFFKKFK